MTQPLNIGIAGLGTVGVGVVKILQDHADLLTARTGRQIRIAAVSARDASKDRGVNLGGISFYNNALDLIPHVDVVVELIGGAEGIAKELCVAALENGKSVVTANKALIAHHAEMLANIAAQHNAVLAYEAAVAGGIPIIKTLKEGLAANRFSEVSGILNGTCNYILTTMEKTGRDFDEVLKEAQEKGYAEADPTFDVDGIDTAHKLAIMAGLAFGFIPQMEPLPTEGIRHITTQDIQYAKQFGYRIKLLGIAKEQHGKVLQQVHPALVPLEMPMASVDDAFNAVQVIGDPIDRVFLEGQGAGEGPTASAVVADIIDIARGIQAPPLGIESRQLKQPTFIDSSEVTGSYYLRLHVEDKPGVLAEITHQLTQADISVRDVVQHAGEEAQTAIVLVTHETTQQHITEAMEALRSLSSVIEAPQMIRIVS